MAVGPTELIIILFIGTFMILMILPFWRIFSKAGYPGALSLLMLIPAVGFLAILFLAFSEWPIHRKMRESGVVIK